MFDNLIKDAKLFLYGQTFSQFRPILHQDLFGICGFFDEFVDDGLKAFPWFSIRGAADRKPWESLQAIINKLVEEAANAEEVLMQYGPELAEGLPVEEQLRILDEIVEHMEGGADLGWWALLRHS